VPAIKPREMKPACKIVFRHEVARGLEPLLWACLATNNVVSSIRAVLPYSVEHSAIFDFTVGCSNLGKFGYNGMIFESGLSLW
jgi:hypothetical protein